jgi:lipopolysaccharide export system permease protein
MKILTRYIIRAHVGPFVFAFSALTGLIFLNAVAQRLDNLAGRGLGLSVIGEFFVLSLPHVVALTFPMSILVATLYAFTDLTGNNEVAAISAGGIHPARLIVPLIAVGLGLGATVFYFNNRVLPEANHRLSSLLTDISSKSPTFQLREEVVNEIHTGDENRYFLRARTIDSETQELTGVTIFDLDANGDQRTITAEHGRMEVTPDRRDLYLTLTNGTILEVPDDDPGTFQRLSYQTQILPMKGVFQQLERQASDGFSDREMTIAMLHQEVGEQRRQLRTVEDETQRTSANAVEVALRGLTPAEMAGAPQRIPAYGDSVGAAEDGSPAQINPQISPSRLVDDVSGIQRINFSRWETYRLSASRYLVEIHKKYAIAMACIIFLLLGPPLAMRFPQGGVGLVIAASVGIFFLYWMGLIGGEELADRGKVDPALAMWAPNLILSVWAAFLLSNVAGRISTNRGSAWTEFLVRMRGLFARFARRGRPGPQAGAEA